MDAETGRIKCIDTGSEKLRKAYAAGFAERVNHFRSAFQKNGADTISISTRDNYMRALMNLFQRRIKKV
jgi:hypothetical protein